MKAFKCDKCKKLSDDLANTLSGSIARWNIGLITHYYPDQYELCDECSEKLVSKIKEWWEEK